MNKIEQEMHEEKLLEWFVEKHTGRILESVHKEAKIKYKDMPWYKKMLYVNDHYQWRMHRLSELLCKEFNDALVSGEKDE